MWALDAMVRKAERERWRKLFGSEFTGFDNEGRTVRLVWRETVIGHVCVGDDAPFGHLNCIRIYGPPRWVFERGKKKP